MNKQELVKVSPAAQSLAQFMHEVYEETAQKNCWRTQKKCRVDFDKLPLQNQNTMLHVAEMTLARFCNNGWIPPHVVRQKLRRALTLIEFKVQGARQTLAEGRKVAVRTKERLRERIECLQYAKRVLLETFR